RRFRFRKSVHRSHSRTRPASSSLLYHTIVQRGHFTGIMGEPSQGPIGGPPRRRVYPLSQTPASAAKARAHRTNRPAAYLDTPGPSAHHGSLSGVVPRRQGRLPPSSRAGLSGATPGERSSSDRTPRDRECAARMTGRASRDGLGHPADLLCPPGSTSHVTSPPPSSPAPGRPRKWPTTAPSPSA